MRNRGFIIAGGILIFWGVLILLSELLNIDFWDICWPVVFILAGVWLLLRPRLVAGKTHINISPLNDTRRSGAWQVSPEEIYTLVGNTRLDFTQAEIQSGETTIRVYGFVGEIKVYLPSDLAFSVDSWAFVNDARILDQKLDQMLTPVAYTSPDYEAAEKKVHLETFFFVMNLRVMQA
jgi:hypothetical protein